MIEHSHVLQHAEAHNFSKNHFKNNLKKLMYSENTRILLLAVLGASLNSEAESAYLINRGGMVPDKSIVLLYIVSHD